MSPSIKESSPQSCLALIRTLQNAIDSANEAGVLEACLELMANYSFGVKPVSLPEELNERRLMHETVDCALRGLLLAQDSPCEFWKSFMLPLPIGALNHGNMISNGAWLRRSGSNVPDTNDEVLDPNVLTTLDLAGQAKMLGRFIVANDGSRVVDYPGVALVLASSLLPVWTEWVLGCHAQSPDAIANRDVQENQERTLDEVLEFWKEQPLELPSTPISLATVFERPYRTAGSTAPVAKKLSGELLANLYWSMGPADVVGLKHFPEFESLRDSEFLVFCPNWRAKHVIHRCLSPLLEPMRERASTNVLLLHEPGKQKLGSCPADWASGSVESELVIKGHYLYNIGLAAEELRSCNIDMMFFPELTPSNASAWVAMQRVARVQATGYGFPSTSGSQHMDYFLGGADIEGDGSDYTEQLVVIPGWGQAMVVPPQAPRPRQRAEVDDQVQIATIATVQKLNSCLLKAWNEVLRGEPNASLEIFPSITDVKTQLLAPRIAPFLADGAVSLNGWTPRETLLDTLVQSDFYLDTFPYGGYNCLIEALAAGLPIVTIEGQRARNRTASVLLRRLGMPEFLIAKDYGEYIAAAKRLIRDAGLRKDLRARLADREAVLAVLHDAEAPTHYAAAIDWMRSQGPRNGRAPGPPVLIRAGEAPRLLEAS
ncbi:MAG: hypothetical protein ACI8X5_002931 [Planctomycetota bacterium]|jgi:hypothetical protein